MADQKSTTGTKRVKSGCITCRIRRVKCDEEKPACKKCTSTGRKCDGYSTLPFSRRELVQAASSDSAQSTQRRRSPSPTDDALIARLISDPAFSDVLEKRYFQFFRQRTVQSTTCLMGSRFWDRCVLQACHLEPAVRHAALALGALHQLSEMSLDYDGRERHIAFTEQQHHKALEAAKLLVASAQAHDVDRVLIACVIFICFEAVRGNYIASHVHMQSGRAIWMNHQERLMHHSRRSDLTEIVNTLARMDVSALTFQDRSAPMELTLTDLYRSRATLEVLDFESLMQARASLVDLVRWTLVCDMPISNDEVPGDPVWTNRYLTERAKCLAQLRLWRHQFEMLVQRQPELEATAPVTLMRIQHAGAASLMEAGAIGPETRFDDQYDYFLEVVTLAELVVAQLSKANNQGTFSLEPGYVDVCFSTATRCRDAILRRRAVQVLRALPRQENTWHSTGAAAIADEWIRIEEEGLVGVQRASDVPEYNRVHEVNLAVNVAARSAHLRFKMVETSDFLGAESVVKDSFVTW